MLGVPDGVEIVVVDQIDSTNDEARRRVHAGALGPLWIRAYRQTKGRGRRGRSWLSEHGNLFMTGLLTLDCTPLEAANLSFVSALAVAQAIDQFVAPAAVRLKWPNDVLIHDHKTSGILLESWTSTAGLHMAIGIGVNVVTRPANLDQNITCVAAHQASDRSLCDASMMFSYIVHYFHIWLAVWRDQGFKPIREAWLKRAKGLGEPIVARLPHETIDGIFRGLCADGALNLELADGTYRHITAGDVFFTGEGMPENNGTASGRESG